MYEAKLALMLALIIGAVNCKGAEKVEKPDEVSSIVKNDMLLWRYLNPKKEEKPDVVSDSTYSVMVNAIVENNVTSSPYGYNFEEVDVAPFIDDTQLKAYGERKNEQTRILSLKKPTYFYSSTSDSSDSMSADSTSSGQFHSEKTYYTEIERETESELPRDPVPIPGKTYVGYVDNGVLDHIEDMQTYLEEKLKADIEKREYDYNIFMALSTLNRDLLNCIDKIELYHNDKKTQENIINSKDAQITDQQYKIINQQAQINQAQASNTTVNNVQNAGGQVVKEVRRVSNQITNEVGRFRRRF